MALNNNVDEWAGVRLNIFFPGFPAELTGQCVSLVKWFLQEMCESIPNPQGARGNAKDYGENLVAQGIATRVNAGQRKRGDIVVWPQDGGGYGHIGVLLSGDRIFEQNVGLPGVSTAVYGGNRVYASRVDPLVASWRKGGALYYRVNNYIENIKGAGEMVIPDADNYYGRYQREMDLKRGRDIIGAGFTREEFRKYLVGQTDLRASEIISDDPEAERAHNWMRLGYVAQRDNYPQQITDRTAERDRANKALTETNAKLAEVSAKAELSDELQKEVDELAAKNKALLDQQTADTNSVKDFLRRIAILLKIIKE